MASSDMPLEVAQLVFAEITPRISWRVPSACGKVMPVVKGMLTALTAYDGGDDGARNYRSMRITQFQGDFARAAERNAARKLP